MWPSSAMMALRPYGPVDWCEITRGRDFFAWTTRVDWIVTNPPWSQFRRVLRQALAVADHVALVCTLNHLWTKARRQDVRRGGSGWNGFWSLPRRARGQSRAFSWGWCC
jgi:hypothetical protein